MKDFFPMDDSKANAVYIEFTTNICQYNKCPN